MKGYVKTYIVEGLGTIWIAQGSKGILKTGIGIKKERFIKSLPRNITWVDKTQNKLKKLPTRPLDLSTGTPFEQKVWRQIRKIPKGETRSYAWLAKTAGRPKAIRAAANACGTNPLPILIPCHRVIKSDGSIGGFSGPLKLKKLLLKKEGVHL